MDGGRMQYCDEKGTIVSHRRSLGVTKVTGGVRMSVAAIVLCVFLLAVQASPSYARQARLFAGSFGGANSTPANPYPLSSAGLMAVAVDDATHDVYVTDQLNHRVERFGPAGEFLLMFGKEVNLTKVLAAAPEAEQNVCTAVSFDTCQVGTSTVSPGGFSFPASISVDNSSGESKGDVYVADGAGFVSKFDSAGNLISSWASKGALNGSGVSAVVNEGRIIKGPFVGLTGLAVDTSGNVWVADGNRQMFEFRQDASFINGWIRDAVGGEAGIAVDSEDNVYVNSDIRKLVSAGNEIGPILAVNSGLTATGLTVDPTHDELYADIGEGSTSTSFGIQRYASSCHPLPLGNPDATGCTPVESFGSNHLSNSKGLAIDPGTPADTLYVAENPSYHGGEVAVFSVETVPDVSTLKATGFTSGYATLNGSVNPSGVELKAGLEGCRFEWGETETYGNVAACDQSAVQIGSGLSPVEVSATITGLQQGKTYHFRLLAGNANDVNSLIDEPSQGGDLAFGPPAIESTSAVTVAANGATVQAQVNPNNVDTRVRVEYGSEAGVYDHSTPEAALGADGTGELVPFQLSGLTPNTVYHYRVVAENALGEGAQAVIGPDRAFITQAVATGSSLLDGRGWELVSPPDKHGSLLEPIAETGVVQASVAGDAISYRAKIPTEDEPAGFSSQVQVLSRRTGDGWESQDLALPHGTSTGLPVGIGYEYRLFSSDLSLAVAQPFGPFDQRVSAEASEQTAFLRTNYPSGNVDSPCLVSCYRPLVTGAPGYENVPSGTVLAPGCKSCGPTFVGASPDLSHVVLSSEAALTEGAPEDSKGEGSLYEWSGGSLALVSVLPDEQPAPVSSRPVLGEPGVERNAVSVDGSRIVWSDNKQRLYVRDTVLEKTVQIGVGAVQFQTTSSDGSKILFTEESSNSGNHGDLRECDIVASEGELHCDVTDLTPVGAGENPGVVGLVPGASNDASYVYFVSNAVLGNNGAAVPGAKPGGCDTSTFITASCNLYVRHDGLVRLVAVLSNEDMPDVGPRVTGLSSRVSPDGQWLEFMSDRSLTGYDNRDSVTGRPDEEVYLYDAAANAGAGMVVCASCDPTGARPHGYEYHRLYQAGGGGIGGLVNTGFYSDQGIAGSVPGWIAYRNGLALYQPRYLSDSGRLFFDSYDALVPQDSNGTGDVYEYEPAGVGDCASAGGTFVASSNGCVGLISSGTSKEESAFLDASENGNDVFFLTSAQLSHRDTDSVIDVYDARVGGGFPEAPPLPVCEGDACQSPVSAPEDPTPGSLTYSGPGNSVTPSTAVVGNKRRAKVSSRAQKLARALRVCLRVRSRGARGVCLARAHRRYGRAKAGSTTRRGGR
jgi:hypothetical protein